jgi:PTH1 family peptidyl-tRNA hydrolase
VGLGNPGDRYRDTRHNVGFVVVDELARRAGAVLDREAFGALVGKTFGAEPVLLAKPLTFMNLSGQAVQALAHFHKIEAADLLIVADDANLPLGRVRARPGGSAGGHNGFKSVAQALGTDQFPRLRIGVGRGEGQRDLADHVLSRFDAGERTTIDEAIARAVDAAEVFVRDGIDAMMNRFNAEPVEAGRKELSDTADDQKDSQS